ncbi:MAG: hypothetical protein NWR42_02960 [Desulfobacterales bacterium]|nr:hypothetical protein [Desulfobacterales bacterium]
MAATYWKIAAEKIAKGLGPKTIGKLGTSGRLFARAGGVIGIGFMAFELFKSYKDNIENEPAYKEMVILQHEFEKWGSAVSCIGRKPFRDEQYGDLDEGGAINALHKKRFLDSKETKPADPEEAVALIKRAIGYIEGTENVLEDTEFEGKRSDLIKRLERLRQKITTSEDYSPIQKELTEIMTVLKPIESAYSSRIYDCSREIQKKAGSNAAWATLSMVTLGLVNKPVK